MKKIMVIMLMCFIIQPIAAEEKLKVLLDWFVNPDHAPMIIAQQRGIFKEFGLDVDLIAPADPSAPPKFVAAKQADLAISYQPQLHQMVAQKLPLVRIATIVATPLNSLVVLADSDIKTPGDLKGKKIGYSVGGFEDIILTTMLGKYGVSLDDVELVNVNFSLSPSLFAGTTDAVIGAFRNFELNQMDIENRPGRAFYVEEHDVPIYDELIVVAHRDLTRKNIYKKFIAAVEKATHMMINDPQQAWLDFISYDDNLNDELNKRAMRDTLPRFALRPSALDSNRYEKFAIFMRDNKMIETIPDLSSYAVELK